MKSIYYSVRGAGHFRETAFLPDDSLQLGCLLILYKGSDQQELLILGGGTEAANPCSSHREMCPG